MAGVREEESTCIYKASQVVLVVNNLPASAGDVRDAGSIPGWGRSPGGRNGNPLQYFCLENSTDRGVWQARVPAVAESDMTEDTCTKAMHRLR